MLRRRRFGVAHLGGRGRGGRAGPRCRRSWPGHTAQELAFGQGEFGRRVGSLLEAELGQESGQSLVERLGQVGQVVLDLTPSSGAAPRAPGVPVGVPHRALGRKRQLDALALKHLVDRRDCDERAREADEGRQLVTASRIWIGSTPTLRAAAVGLQLRQRLQADQHGDGDQKAMRVDLTEVPYDGTGPALTDLVGGQVDFMCDQN